MYTLIKHDGKWVVMSKFGVSHSAWTSLITAREVMRDLNWSITTSPKVK